MTVTKDGVSAEVLRQLPPYPSALVERIGAAIYQHDNFVDGPIDAETLAVAVLDALNGAGDE